MKKGYLIIAVVLLVSQLISCSTSDDYSGTYIGYSWKGEVSGVTLEEATQKIQTILTLDESGVITDAQIVFWKLIDNHWVSRQGGSASVAVDFNVTPTAALPGEDYKSGNSMFDVQTIDMMSFYAVEISDDGTAAVLIVEPTTRYQFEMKLDANFDYKKTISEMTIESGYLVPTVRASSKGLVKVSDWSELEGKDIFNFHPFAGVLTSRGTFEGLDSNSTVQELLESMGVSFTNSKPDQTGEIHGFHSLGGWAGNYTAIEDYLIGKNATEVTSLVDWSVAVWANSVNDDNFFGVETISGATNTAQNSVNTISGATVRMSRESTSYQRALVDAGILKEEDVIKGRF